MSNDIQSTVAMLEADGWTSTLVRGAMRQATFFRVGAALPRTRQHEVHYIQGNQTWSSDAVKPVVAPCAVSVIEIGLGTDLALAAALTVDPSAEVAAYLRRVGAPVRRLLTVMPASGADDQSVTSGGHAVAYAEQIRNAGR